MQGHLSARNAIPHIVKIEDALQYQPKHHTKMACSYILYSYNVDGYAITSYVERTWQ